MSKDRARCTGPVLVHVPHITQIMDIPRISSTSNARVKLTRRLQRKRHREETGLCVLEGDRLVQDAWDAGAVFHSLFVREDRLATLEPWLAQLHPHGVPLYAVTETVMAALCETMTPQGLLALVEKPQLPPPAQPRLILLLDRLRDPGNAGTLLRSAAAAGVDLVLFGPQTVDPFGGKVLRGAMGAHFRVPLRVCNAWQEVDHWLEPDRALYVADIRGELAYDQVDWTKPSALIVGGEAQGPSPEAHRRATPVVIPMARQTESLNAAVAGAVILFEAARQRRRSRR